MVLMGLREYARSRKERGLPGGVLSAVQKAIKSGRIAGAVHGDRLDKESADVLWTANSHPIGAMQQSAHTAEGAISYAESRALREHYGALLAQTKYEVLRGQLVNSQAVKDDWDRTAVLIRNRVLGLPSKIHLRIPELTRERIVLIDGMLRECLTELAALPPGVTADDENGRT